LAPDNGLLRIHFSKSHDRVGRHYGLAVRDARRDALFNGTTQVTDRIGVTATPCAGCTTIAAGDLYE
jgi:hypothetical protein